jgi:hypothetical protein
LAKTKYTPPPETVLLRRTLANALKTRDNAGRVVASAKHGVYLFYDYDGEPIYVGQTYEKLSARIGRHLTNQRTDAVAMNVLDPFEVAEIELWPFFELAKLPPGEAKETLNKAEYTVFKRAVTASQHHAILNEGDIAPTEEIMLPPSIRVRIVPPEFFNVRKHPDTRIARRASTIAALARVISERQVSKGLRRTLLTQAQRLEHLARERLGESDEPIPIETPDKEE